MNTTIQASDLAHKLISSLDIDAYEDIPVGKLTLLDPKTQEPTDTYIELASPEHEARKRIDLARTRKLRAAFSSTGKVPSTDPLDEIEEETDYLVASTLGWNLKRGGVPVEFTPAAVRAMYTDPKRQWLRAQVAAGVRKSELFIKDSAKA